MAKDRHCKNCRVYIESVAKYVKYQGLCGKCFQISRLPAISDHCHVCNLHKGGQILGLFGTAVCGEKCQSATDHYCKDNIHNSCLLTHHCCVCRDSRPIQKEGSYDGYIDGIGHVTMKNRWDFYCDSCRQLCHGKYALSATITL